MENTAIILIDIQSGFDDASLWGGSRNNPSMEANAAQLLAHGRKSGVNIIHVQHASRSETSPLHPQSKGFAFKEGFEPLNGEKHIIKHENSAFIGTDLEDHLRQHKIAKTIICGISTEHCVSTTTRMAGNLGFEVRLVGDACHAWPKPSLDGKAILDAETIHTTELAILHNEFAIVQSTQATQATIEEMSQ